MKKTAIALCAAALAATGIISLAGSVPERLNTVKISTSENSIWFSKDTVLYVNDIDSIEFNTGRQILSVYTSVQDPSDPGDHNVCRMDYYLSRMSWVGFGYLGPDEVSSTSFLGYMSDNNKANIFWRPVAGAAGYEIRYASGSKVSRNPFEFNWDDKDACDGSVTAGPDVTECKNIGPLDYQTNYYFAIRTLSPKGEGFHSPWSMRNNFHGSWNYLSLMTHERGPVAGVIKRISDRSTTGFTAEFDLTFNESDYDPYDLNYILRNHVIENGKFVADKAVLINTLTSEKTYRTLTEEELATGKLKYTGLTSGTPYRVTLTNSKIEFEPDALYEWKAASTLAEKQAPILIPGGDESNPNDITSFLDSFMKDNSLADGQLYYLEGDKHYRIFGNQQLTKGIRLESTPEDQAKGKHAKIHLSGNFLLGSMDTELSIDSISFKGIDFDYPGAVNYEQSQAEGVGATGNYFINCYSSTKATEINSFEIRDCSFSGIIRGFFRVQGSNPITIGHLTVDGNLFYDCGCYDTKGSGYGWFNQPAHTAHNIFTDLRFTNNTVYDCPWQAIIIGPTANELWADDYNWNIRIENNTFINFSTRNSGYGFFNTRFVPSGSYYSFQRNLIVLADDSGTRTLNQAGADIRTICGAGKFSFDVKDNYSVGCRDAHLVDNGIFTSNQLSYTKNSFGAFPESNLGTANDLIVKVGSTPLRATDLFTSPNNDPSRLHKAPANILEALKYRDTEAVRKHEIYTLNIGDQRWK